MNFPETDYALRRALEIGLPKLKVIMLEVSPLETTIPVAFRGTQRMEYWHDWRHTAMAWRLIAESPMAVGERCREFDLHTMLFFRWLTNPGRGVEWLQAHFFPAEPREDMGWMKRAGFDPAVEMGVWTERARADFARQVAAVTDALPPRSARPGFTVALQELVVDLRESGIEPIFVIPPTVRPEENLVGALPEGLTIFHFNRPAEYPQLFLPENRVESRHLNERGASEFTRLVAERFADHVGRR